MPINPKPPMINIKLRYIVLSMLLEKTLGRKRVIQLLDWWEDKG